METTSKVERIDDTMLIRFDRPEMLNSLSLSIVSTLIETIEAICSQSVAKVVFTGSGDAFASGADLREIRGLTNRTARSFALRGQTLMAKIEDLPVPAIAAINGYCFGGGLDLALACKSRIASPKAVFCHPGVGLGIITGWGGTQRLPRLVGQARALEMLLSASRVPAAEALRIGLVDEIADDVLAAALKWPAVNL